ncbi:3-isopropylmalate dehydratase large subunit, chloroplastic-like [Phoenix dactylifera]|uniref:3-isopropylmalate dehydratase large subunit, chloroplastic-like n=1 Tax=Phoenix dactylifera TaxID=42345 RepID=A0A8B9A2K0_PHODC|nr:3-isopropylmalate dehydratase large subunit, chloroplastic-like [Phoenix dactylifera]
MLCNSFCYLYFLLFAVLLHVHSNEDPAYVFDLMLHYLANEFLFYDQGKKVKVPTFLVPATQKVWMDIYGLPVPGSGGKTCSQIFEEAGCEVPASPSCAACMGGPLDTYARINERQASLLSRGISLEIFLFVQPRLVASSWFNHKPLLVHTTLMC